jgi:MFS transporter, NNP family, nitrate/nitrite transporter
VTGVVGAAGGLGGFIPPLVMGSIYSALSSYALGLIALAAVALVMLGLAALMTRAPQRSEAVGV